MNRTIRYQGAIVRDDCLLLIKHREHATGRAYWVIPGGGREPDETEEACVQREMWEETQLRVDVERLLLDDAAQLGDVYQRRKTYLCHAATGEPQPGYEPEEEAAQNYGIVDVGWFDLRAPETWDPLAKDDAITYTLMRQIQAVLGYAVEADPSTDQRTL